MAVLNGAFHVGEESVATVKAVTNLQSFKELGSRAVHRLASHDFIGMQEANWFGVRMWRHPPERFWV